MQAVGNQRLRVGEPADYQLHNGHHQIDRHANPCRALRLERALGLPGDRRWVMFVCHVV